ncbi:MAG: hypothetical protein SNJ78_10105 [Spirochaetales bacterium]
MKKVMFVLMIALAATGLVFAQPGPAPWGRQMPYAPIQSQQELVKVDGTLSLINGMIGVKSGSKTYYTPMLARLAGFIEGIKEGGFVRLEGYAFPIPAAPEYNMLRVTKLSVGGKEYDFSQMPLAWGQRGNMPYSRRGMMGPQRW